MGAFLSFCPIQPGPLYIIYVLFIYTPFVGIARPSPPSLPEINLKTVKKQYKTTPKQPKIGFWLTN